MHSRPLYSAIKLTYLQKIECGELDATFRAVDVILRFER